jgi:hypothetical protein
MLTLNSNNYINITNYNKFNLSSREYKLNQEKKDFINFGNSSKTPLVKSLLWVNKYCGEGMNQTINALGKGAIAPLVVIFNPLLKEDKQTKEYYALRLIIDAAIMFAGQFAINSAASKIIKNYSQKGILGDTFTKGANASKRAGILTSRFSFVLTFITLPLLCTFISKATPAIIKKINPEIMADNQK